MKKIEVCVGSSNPTKIQAVKIAFDKIYRDYNLFHINADSKIPNQPIGIDIILKGAFNRAKEANSYLKHKFKDNSEIFGVGIEAGLVKISMANSNYLDFQFCVIIDKDDKLSLGSGTAFEYPQYIIDDVIANKKEIGEIIGILANNMNLKNENGAIGYLSNNFINRRDILYQAVICALLPQINKELYLNSKH